MSALHWLAARAMAVNLTLGLVQLAAQLTILLWFNRRLRQLNEAKRQRRL